MNSRDAQVPGNSPAQDDRRDVSEFQQSLTQLDVWMTCGNGAYTSTLQKPDMSIPTPPEHGQGLQMPQNFNRQPAAQPQQAYQRSTMTHQIAYNTPRTAHDASFWQGFVDTSATGLLQSISLDTAGYYAVPNNVYNQFVPLPAGSAFAPLRNSVGLAQTAGYQASSSTRATYGSFGASDNAVDTNSGRNPMRVSKLAQAKKRRQKNYSDQVKHGILSNVRTGQACDRCKVRKIKCDTEPQGCSYCVRAHLQCCVTDRVTGHTARRGIIPELERDRDITVAFIRDIEKLCASKGVVIEIPEEVQEIIQRVDAEKASVEEDDSDDAANTPAAPPPEQDGFGPSQGRG